MHIIKKILNNANPTNQERKCNCRNTLECPLNQNCLSKSIVYQAIITRQDNNKSESYVGLCETTFKARYSNHKASFNHADKKNQTELRKYVWSLKENNINFNIKWKTIASCRAYSNTTKKCNLCLTEKYYILCHPELSSLNKRNELASQCRHMRSYLLESCK